MNASSHPGNTPEKPIALITGGSRGLGRSTAIHLAQRGVDVIFTYRSQQAEADAVCSEITRLGGKALALQLDVGNSASFAAFAEQLGRDLRHHWQRDHFDYLVNNAGSGINASFAETSEAQFDEMMNIHLKGAFFLTQSLLPLIVDGGKIVNLSSGLARFSYPGRVSYAIMKGAVEVLTRYLALELGPRGISANTVAPGAIATDFSGGVVRDNAAVNAHIAAQTALGRVGQPDDIGGMISSLLMDQNRWVNGQRIEVSGGVHL
jgi:NAD(P)-dependent dehydrogenase (short-subunit alcohol dehydrogenase family)